MFSEAIRFPIRRFKSPLRGSMRFRHDIVIGCFTSNFRPTGVGFGYLWAKDFCLLY
jgi:hypothetical protein